MVPTPNTAAALDRLAGQLQRLCELSESLTYRLLELEERLQLCEGKLGSDPAAVAGDGELVQRLGETEGRLARLEAVLQGLPSPDADRPPQPPERRAA